MDNSHGGMHDPRPGLGAVAMVLLALALWPFLALVRWARGH